MDSRTYPCTLRRVVDGDTVYLNVDLGFRVFGAFEFRLYGINCPEMNTPEGKAAKRFAEDWFAQNAESVLSVVSYKDPEKYGRWLGVVIAMGPKTTTLNDDLITSGHAQEYMTK